MTPKVSVIIPVYNVEKYIERCARSLFEQTMSDGIEFIFVDDCSRDDSIAVLSSVLSQYPERKIQTIILKHKQNKGQALARKTGIDAAKGEYIIHCDSDDWVAPEMYEKLYGLASENDYDMVWCDYYRSDGINHALVPQQCEPEREPLLKAHLSSRLIASLCNRLCKSELQKSKRLVFPVANMTEDMVIITQATLNAKRIGYLHEPLYYYYANPQSICLIPNKDKILNNFRGQIANSKIVFHQLDLTGLSEVLKKEIHAKKCTDKDALRPILDNKEVRKLWKQTYPEVGFSFLTDALVPVTSRVRAAAVLFNFYPLLSFLRKHLNG